ncbi:MAG: carbamoyltransferase [Candidatus Aenigmarchaeota archaeon]|nr:carbamoyltransferase [Candidatus Aenigmarchaeota archaeon]
MVIIMAYYLGLTIPIGWGHDPSACLIKDNKILAFAEEERFNRYKHSFSLFPRNAIKYCLDFAGIKISDVVVGFNFDPKKFKRGAPTPRKMIGARISEQNMRNMTRLVKFYFGADPKQYYLAHHLAHAFSSFPLSGLQSGVSFNLDAVGERTSTLLGNFAGSDFNTLVESDHSLGYFYSRFTQWLGFDAVEGEGTVMGLAPYGKPVHDLSEFARPTNGSVPFYSKTEPEDIEKKFGTRRYGPVEEVHKNMAASIQETLEKIMIHMAHQYKADSLVIAGGIGLNCVANGRLVEEGYVKDVFIQPAAGDAGGSIGAAVWLAMQDGHKFDKMEHIYYGPGYTNEQIKKVLDLCDVDYEFHKDIAGKAAELIAKDKIIGWFQGRMEGGPRALGNRSILANPTNPKMKDILNSRVKHREPWRPFCPSILYEDRAKYFSSDKESPFMILAFHVKKEMQKEIPAVVHVDGTARPQTVRRSQNPLYYKLLQNLKKEIGHGVVINTSFNVKGEPVVCRPEDAVRCFFGTGMDALAIGNYLVKK